MRKKFAIPIVILFLLLIHGCKKEEKPAIPVITTTEVTEITYTTATSGGDATNDGGAPIVSRGVCWNTAVNPTITNSKTTATGTTGSFTSNMAQLTPNTLYYVRAYATNSTGTAYGDQVSFTTMQTLAPAVTTAPEFSYTATSAATGGNVTADNGAAVTERGFCWSTNPNPTTSDSKTSDGGGSGIFFIAISDLTPNTTYYMKAYAINSQATSYGEEISFKTFAAVDIDGNGYSSVTIGTQTWLVENLKTSKYQNGDIIGTTNSDITVESTPKYQWVDDNNYAKLGRLYTWYAVTDSRGICPTGWHVPSANEFRDLTTYLGGAGFSGGKLKESGTTTWLTPNTSANNSSGFTGLPGGYRDSNGSYYNKGKEGYLWSTSEMDPTYADYLGMEYNSSYAGVGSWQKKLGFSVRCLKN